MKRKLITGCIAGALTISMCGTSFAAVLSNGTSGDEVYDLQEALAVYGYFYDTPTGYFGDITESSVRSFQIDYGLEADGIAGPITNSYLGLSGYTEETDYEYSEASLGRALSNGMSGDDVYTLQVLLADYGYFYSIPTGFFGDLTEAAVISFQSDYGLEVDGIAGSATIGMLTGTYTESDYSYYNAYGEDYQNAVLNAISITPATSSGYCAEWVSQVFRNAGILTYNLCNLRSSYYSYAVTSGLADSWYSDNTGFNANDYWAYVCYSSDLSDLQPGMIVASRSSYTYLGKQFGHVGIYIGNGQIVSCVGYIETLSIDEWYSRYNNTEAGSTMCWGFLPY